MKNKQLVGLGGVLGIWLTAGLALPFVNLLTMFSPTQLMCFRGFFTAIVAMFLMRGVSGQPNLYTYAIFFVLPIATLGLFMGVRAWGASPTMIVLAATPAVNILIGVFLGRRILVGTVIGFCLVLTGVVLARWGGTFQKAGFAWSVLATVASAVLYELFARAKGSPFEKCFLGSAGMGLLGLMLSQGDSWQPMNDPKNFILLVGFSFVGGLLYWISNLVAFENLPTNEASVLAQGETPAVLLGAMLLLGEKLTLSQWFGVVIAIVGAALITVCVPKSEEPASKGDG